MFRLRPFHVHLHTIADQLSGIVVYFMVVFSPWAFGSTEPWAVRVMNSSAYGLGFLFLLKLWVRHLAGYQAARWDEAPCFQESSNQWPSAKWLTRALALITILFLAYCFTSALNARATFNERSLTFEYRDCIRWLPHSFDAGASWFAFWTYLGLAVFFWALRDWLFGKSGAEERARWEAKNTSGTHGTGTGSTLVQLPQREPGDGTVHPLLPQRLRRLLWLLAINGAVLGLEAIVQRLADSPKLLFLVQPRIHQTADGQFGAYAYRSNAAQYFNLLWPVALGFWWTLNRWRLGFRNEPAAPQRRQTGPSENMLLVSAAVMAACPIVSTSRAGAFICIALAAATAVVFAAAKALVVPRLAGRARSETRRRFSRALVLFFSVAMILGLALGWNELRPRLTELNDGFAGRERMYEAARPIARDYPWFGIGPGAFETVSQLYPRPEIYWPAQLHNDWLETRITFGWVGMALLVSGLCCIVVRHKARGGIHGGRRFVMLIWLALGGCLLHARFDFPFQIHSTLFLFVLFCAILFTLSRRPAHPTGYTGSL